MGSGLSQMRKALHPYKLFCLSAYAALIHQSIWTMVFV